MAAAGRALVHRYVDGWLLGGFGLVAWVAVQPIGGARGALTGVVSGALLAAAAMHFGASYHLAYGDGTAALRRHPYALVAAPIALLLAGLIVVEGATARASWAEPVLRGLMISVFTLTAWHYIKQAFGVGMLVGRSHGLRPSRRQVLVLRYGLYPVWLFNSLKVWERGRGSTYLGYDVTFDVLPHAAAWLLQGLAVATLVGCFAVVLRLCWQARAIPPLGLWGTYATAGLWFLLPPTYVSAAVVFTGIHAVQYLAVAHRAEVNLAVERHEPNLLHRWLCVFGGAAAGGLLLTTWLPDATGSLATGGLPVVVPALIFVVFNLHHYAIDAVIWRSGGDHVNRIAHGPRVEAAETGPVEPILPADAQPAFA